MSEEAEADEADDASAEAEDAETAPAEDALQDGDVIRLAYTARTIEEGQLVDTTDPEVAEEEGVGDEDTEFEPRTLVLGAGHLFDPLEQDIIGKEVGDTGEITIAAADAFGEYDDDEVRTVSANKIPEDDRYPGAQVQLEGQQGFVETIIGGRARVDFNHPLAGDDIEYDYEIIEEIDEPLDIAAGLFDLMLDVQPEMWIETDEVEEEQMVEPDEDADEDAEPETETVTVEKETLYVEQPPQLQFNQQWMMQKQQIAQQIMDHAGLDRVVIQETIDGSGMGMGGMMGGGMGGMGDMGGGDLEEALEDADIDADELAEEIED